VATHPTVLVTGGAGFAAGHLVERLSAPTADPSADAAIAPRIVAWHRPGGHPPPAGTAGITWRGVDLLDAAAVAAAIATDPPDQVYHLAGATHQGKSFGQATDVLRVNAMGTDHLLRGLAAHAPHARALVTSTGFVYQPNDTDALAEDAPLRPASPYALSKLAQELVARHAAATTPVEVIVCRPFNHLGPRQTADYFAPNFARQIAAIARGHADPVLKVGNLTARRDLSDVRDVVRAYVGLMAGGVPGEVYNVCSGQAVAVRDVLDGLIALSGVRVDVQIAQELLRPVDQPLLLGTRDKIGAAIGWAPAIPLETTLRDLLDEWSARA
jgi:GDP-4-dehydro-6-deoxy-D-mannose reductase